MPPPTPPPPDDGSKNSPSGTRPRLGPRPLALHLQQAAQLCLSSPAGWMNWNAVSPRLKAQAIEAAEATVLRAKGKQNAVPLPLDPGNGPRPELAARLAIESTATLARFVASIQAYRRHPYRRALNDPPSVWRSGQARLLDYGGGGETVLLVPSLINRPYILDLSERASFARWLSARNKRVLLLDWGWPDAAESRFDLGSYVTERLEPALAAAVEIGGGERVSVIGYCMGGTLAVPLAQRNAALIDKLVLLAAPWDFHAEARERALAAAAAFRAWEPLVAAMGILPLDAIETLFATLDPSLVLRKFLRFASLDAQSRAAEDFVALEDWVGDGVPLAAPAAADALVGWYGENRPALGAWRIGGAVIDPASIPNPVLAIVPTRDRIVPPESARALAKRVPQAHMHEVATGHVSLMVGSGAAETVWKPLISFLNG